LSCFRQPFSFKLTMVVSRKEKWARFPEFLCCGCLRLCYCFFFKKKNVLNFFINISILNNKILPTFYLSRKPKKVKKKNHLGGGPVIKVWDQEVCSLCDLRFEPCGCSYDGHWRLTWSLTSGPVELVEVCTSWPGHLYQIKKKKS
jgi:hypothetical protein